MPIIAGEHRSENPFLVMVTYFQMYFPSKSICFVLAALLFSAGMSGCSHSKTERGHLFRGDWAFEYNRTPWIGMPADSGSGDGEKKGCGLFDCFKKEKDGKKGYRRHCGQSPNCTAQNPCCRTLGCGMWVDPSADAQTAMVALGGTAKACGLTPFCSPQKPCGLTPNCGKPVSVNVNPQTLFLGNGAGGSMGGNSIHGNNMSGGLPPAPLTSRALPGTMGNITAGNLPQAAMGTATGGMSATLVGRGIVPGASLILNNSGMVAAIGVSTPAGTMTASGVRTANGIVNPNIVLRSCTMTPNCTAAHPCGLTPGCGGMVALNLVANNAVGLASALQTQGAAGGVMQANGAGVHGMGTLVNPMTNQPIGGVTMSGYPQQGYPPMGYAPTGYAPGYPRYTPGEVQQNAQQNTETAAAEDEVAEENAGHASPAHETRSKMPVPRFQPIPSKPAFQRSEGLKPTPKSQRKPETVAVNGADNEADMEEQLDRAYLEGVAAAMDEIERKIEARQQAAAKAKLQEKILRQTEMMEQQLAAQAAEMYAPMAANEPKRLPVPKQMKPAPVQMASAEMPQAKQVKVEPPAEPKAGGTNSRGGLAKWTSSLKNSLAAELSTLRSPLLGGSGGDNKSGGRKPAGDPDASVAVRTTLPPKPSVSGMRQDYGLLPDSDPAEIQQAEYTGEISGK